jgi:hypothetical protein
MFHFRDFILFLKNPSFGKQFDIKSISSFLKLIWISFLIILLIDIITGILITTPLRYFNLFPSFKELKFTPLNILKITLVLPIIEELIFRLPLRISKANFITSFSIIIFMFLYKLCLSKVYLAISLSLILFLLLYLNIKKESNFLNKLSIFFTKYFRVVFLLQALIFGFLHLINFKLDFKYFYLFPLFAISYISSGYFWGYIRVRYTSGIYVCIASHIVVNSIYCLILS